MDVYLFVFDSEVHAKIFVEKLVLYLKDVAMYRDKTEVKVFDASPNGQREEIYRLAKSSNAQMIKSTEIK